MLTLKRFKVAVAKIGKLDSSAAANAIGLANACQHSFGFSELYEPNFRLKKFRLRNGGYDLDLAATELITKTRLKGYPLLLTEDPYGSKSTEEQSDDFYFCGELTGQGGIVISTHLWFGINSGRSLQSYILFMLGSTLLAKLGGLHFHEETRGCLMDYCAEPKDFATSFANGALCSPCCEQVERSIRAGTISRAQYAACIRLVSRGRGVRRCFVVMPFREELDRVFRKTVSPALQENGYEVVRGDETIWPRIISEAIVSEILSSDLIVADITDHNPNVFYEIGVADAIGADIVLLCQQGQSIPFDINQRRTIYYKPSEHVKLTNAIRALTRSAAS